MKDTHSKIYVPEYELTDLAYKGEWAFGSLRDTNKLGHWVPKVHRRHDEMVDKYGTAAAQNALSAVLYEQERNECAFFHREFIEPEDRIYLYIIDKTAIKNLGARFDKRRKQYYVARGRIDPKQLDPYLDLKAKSAWENALKMKKKVASQWARAAFLNFQHFADRRHGVKWSTRVLHSELERLRPKPKGRMKICNLAPIVGEQLLELNPALVAEYDREISWRVHLELLGCGVEYALPSIHDALFRKCSDSSYAIRPALTLAREKIENSVSTEILREFS